MSRNRAHDPWVALEIDQVAYSWAVICGRLCILRPEAPEVPFIADMREFAESLTDDLLAQIVRSAQSNGWNPVPVGAA